MARAFGTVVRPWRVVGVLALVITGSAVPGRTEASPATCPGWSTVTSPNASSNSNFLNGVAALSPSNAWAVGNYFNGTAYRTLVERWNGTAWHVKSSPNVGTNRNELHGIAATSATNMWAVGFSTAHTSSPARTLVLHWNGSAWKVQTSPNVGTRGSELDAVDAVSAKDAWAVGFTIGSNDLSRTLVEHWNGTSWKVKKSPSVSPSTKNNELDGVAATSASNAWAVGYHSPPVAWASRTLVERWNGTAWKVQASANPGAEDELSGVSAHSSSNAWAVGDLANGSALQTLIEHWNGTAWKRKASPNVGGSSTNNQLNAVTTISKSNAWAVGTYGVSPFSSLAQHWNGTAWSNDSPPSEGTNDNVLDAVAAASGTDVWAVGYYNNGSSFDRTYVVHFC